MREMMLSELISYLKKQEEKYGDVNVCIYNRCHDMPCESIVATMQKDAFYIPICEDRTCQGNYIFFE